jgi:hypothetical protein
MISVALPILLLHGNGWDELLMVAVGLVLAFAVISATGRSSRGPDGEEDLAPDETGDRRA